MVVEALQLTIPGSIHEAEFMHETQLFGCALPEPADSFVWRIEAKGTCGLKIIAVGGGGFTTGTSPGLDDFLLSQIERGARRIGFVGTASDNDPERIKYFRELIAPRVEYASVLPLDARPGDARDWVARHNMVYIGGGNTPKMLARWRATGFDITIAEAGRNGIVLAGVSAGAACWFDSALVRGDSGAMEPIMGLGLLQGSICAHFNLEPDRNPLFREHIASGVLPTGIGIDDGVAVLYRDRAAPVAFSAEPGAWAYDIRPAPDGSASVVRLPAFVPGQSSA